jgi:hypothetical protein
MSTLVRVQARGSGEAVAVAVAAVGNLAQERGWRVYVESPPDLAAGGGRFEIEVPNIENEADARAVVRSLLDQVPGAAGVMELIDRD